MQDIAESLTPEQTEMFQIVAANPAIIMQLGGAVAMGNALVFELTLGGLAEKEARAFKQYFNACRQFLNQPEIAKLIES